MFIKGLANLGRNDTMRIGGWAPQREMLVEPPTGH